MSEIFKTEQDKLVFNAYWDGRHRVLPENKCPTPLTYPETGLSGECVLDKSHISLMLMDENIEEFQANVPHADKDGRLAPLPFSWQTMMQARELPKILEEERNDRARALRASEESGKRAQDREYLERGRGFRKDESWSRVLLAASALDQALRDYNSEETRLRGLGGGSQALRDNTCRRLLAELARLRERH